MALTKKEKQKNVHEAALVEYDDIIGSCKDEREQSLQDRRFYSIAGAQWEGPLGEQFENKPKFEVNKIHLALIRIFNEYRNNRITVDFVSKEGKSNDKLADVCDGLYRADEQDSVADEAYDNAFDEGVGGGIGGWRLRAHYEDEQDDEDERQRIRIEPIFDADSSIFFDLNAKRQDKSDAKSCFVITSMTRAAYEEEYDEDPTSWPKDVHQSEFDWFTPDVVYVAEHYKVESKSETVHIWKGLDGKEERYTDADFKDDEDLEDRLLAVGSNEVRQKKVKRKKVHKYILSGGGILEDCGYIAGTCIPIIPMYGKRWFVDNVERFMGHVRLAKDSQRLKNMQTSKLAEISALSSVEKPILTPEQISGHATMWSDDNLKNFPYLLINPITNADGQIAPSGPLAYTKVPNIPPAMAALLQITEQDLSDLLGNQQAGEQLQPNISGKAVELIQNRLDMQVFIYMSNMAKAMKRSGEVWLSMARDLYVEEGREMKALSKDGKVSTVKLGGSVINEETGELETENDLSNAKFDIAASVGPSSDSKRAATVRALTGMASITTDPETQQVLSAMTMMNMEGEGISEARDFFRKKLVRIGAVKPTEEEAEQLAQEAANQPPDANTQYLQAAAEEATANAQRANADTVGKLATADKTQAQTQEILAGIDLDKLKAAVELMDKMQPAEVVVPEIVGQADEGTVIPEGAPLSLE